MAHPIPTWPTRHQFFPGLSQASWGVRISLKEAGFQDASIPLA